MGKSGQERGDVPVRNAKLVAGTVGCSPIACPSFPTDLAVLLGRLLELLALLGHLVLGRLEAWR